MIKIGHMHLNRKKQTIPELCLNFNELLQKIFINILEVRSLEKNLPFFFGKKYVFLGTYCQISSVLMKTHIMFLHVWNLLITQLFWHWATFHTLFWCLLMNIFLTQFWTGKLLIHKPQPRHMHNISEIYQLFCSFHSVMEWQKNSASKCHKIIFPNTIAK